MANYGFGTNEPQIKPATEGGDRVNTFAVKVKALFAELYANLNNDIKGTATASSEGYMSVADKTKLDGIAPRAEVNQNAFSNVKVGNTTISADSKTDTLTLAAGTGVTMTPDATNDKVTIAFSGNADTTGNAATATSATKLQNARTVVTNLNSSSAASFNGTANITPGVTGTLPIAHGGTGNNVGNAVSATKLQSARSIVVQVYDAAQGNVLLYRGSANFDGSSNVTLTMNNVNCMSGCATSCSTTCTGTCTGSCSGGCYNTCRNGCTSDCSSSCSGGCDSYGGGCDCSGEN